jgi:ankyrin repeat protein
MKIMKAFVVVLAFCLPLTAFALTDDEQVEYTDALRTGNVKVVKKFLDAGTDANYTSFAWSGLQMAAGKGQLEAVKLLVEHGANVNYQHPITKMTALHLAAYEGYNDVVKYLLEHGADPNIKLRGNVSILRVVRDLGNTKTAEILEAAGAKNDGCQEEKCL